VKWIRTWEKIFDSFDVLKKMLEDRAICTDDHIEIFDPPFSIKILKEERIIFFQLDGVNIAILDGGGLQLHSEDVKDFVEDWCVALTSLGFKRYFVKKRG
jgi:hypothetical protein